MENPGTLNIVYLKNIYNKLSFQAMKRSHSNSSQGQQTLDLFVSDACEAFLTKVPFLFAFCFLL